jgi:hypothetical protein
MQDQEFVALGPAEAYEYAIQQSAPERVRLLQLYRKARGVEAARGDGAVTPRTAAEQSLESLAELAAPKSLMLLIGRIGTCACALGLLLCLVVALGGAVGFIEIVVSGVLGSLLGLFALMWMLGALERRLIDISVILRSRS